jgi:undecaprenyl-diphosphatase
MEFVWAVVLGVVQGVTEFLPVSSSGHLAVAQEKLGMEGPRLLMTTALHAGTLGSIVVVYWKDLRDLVLGTVRSVHPRIQASGQDRESLSYAVAIVLACLVTAPIGLLLEPRIEGLSRDLPSCGGFFLITGLLLLGTRFLRPGARPVGYAFALVIGLAQGLAVFPGISRSGATIATALVLGVHRDQAVRFSFLAALPVLAGALLLEGGLEMADLAARWPVYLLGGLSAFGAGWVSLGLLIRITHRGRLHFFAPYLLILGLALIVI